MNRGRVPPELLEIFMNELFESFAIGLLIGVVIVAHWWILFGRKR